MRREAGKVPGAKELLAAEGCWEVDGQSFSGLWSLKGSLYSSKWPYTHALILTQCVLKGVHEVERG